MVKHVDADRLRRISKTEQPSRRIAYYIIGDALAAHDRRHYISKFGTNSSGDQNASLDMAVVKLTTECTSIISAMRRQITFSSRPTWIADPVGGGEEVPGSVSVVFTDFNDTDRTYSRRVREVSSGAAVDYIWPGVHCVCRTCLQLMVYR